MQSLKPIEFKNDLIFCRDIFIVSIIYSKGFKESDIKIIVMFYKINLEFVFEVSADIETNLTKLKLN